MYSNEFTASKSDLNNGIAELLHEFEKRTSKPSAVSIIFRNSIKGATSIFSPFLANLWQRAKSEQA